MERRILSSDELETALTGLQGWSIDESTIRNRREFENFAGALEFVNRVGALAEAADHHPDISFGWGYAEIALTTHDRGGVTDVDIALAQKIDTLK